MQLAACVDVDNDPCARYRSAVIFPRIDVADDLQ